MPLFPASFIDDLKSHVDIVQVVQERVPLRKSGVTWKGLCPFHGEKTPSFHVNGEKGFFHCFGCGLGGDVIKFVELYDKVGFPDAVRQLAARAGLAVPEAEDARQDGESSARARSAAQGARGSGGVVPRAARRTLRAVRPDGCSAIAASRRRRSSSLASATRRGRGCAHGWSRKASRDGIADQERPAGAARRRARRATGSGTG